MFDFSFFENNKINICKLEFKLYDLRIFDINN